MAMIVADNPDPDAAIPDVIEKVIWKALQIAASQTTRIEMEELWIRTRLLNPDSEFRKEIVFQFVRDVAVFLQDFVQVRLDPAMESSGHEVAILKPIHRS